MTSEKFEGLASLAPHFLGCEHKVSLWNRWDWADALQLAVVPTSPCCFPWHWPKEFIAISVNFNSCFPIVRQYFLHVLASVVCMPCKCLFTSKIYSFQPASNSRTKDKKNIYIKLHFAWHNIMKHPNFLTRLV